LQVIKIPIFRTVLIYLFLTLLLQKTPKVKLKFWNPCKER